MKNNLVVLSLVAIFTLFAGIAAADSGATMRVNVPFAFYAGEQQLPAGEYTFQMGARLSGIGTVVTVRAIDGTGLCMLLTRSDTDKDQAKLLFNKYGSKHFLSSISIQGFKASLRMMKLEKELRAETKTNPGVVQVALR